MTNLFTSLNVHNLPERYFNKHLIVVNYFNEVLIFNFQINLYNFLNKSYKYEGIEKTETELWDLVNKLITHVAVKTYLQGDLKVRYLDVLLYKPTGITNDEDMHMLNYNINKFEGLNTWVEILQFDEELALQIIDWLESLIDEVQSKDFLYENNISMSTYNYLWDISIDLMNTIIISHFWVYPQNEENLDEEE